MFFFSFFLFVKDENQIICTLDLSSMDKVILGENQCADGDNSQTSIYHSNAHSNQTKDGIFEKTK